MYVKREFPQHLVWDIVLGVVFAVWVLYCFTFGVKWEMKHLEEKAKKIEQQEDELLSGLEEQMGYLNTTLKKQKKEKEEHKNNLKIKRKFYLDFFIIPLTNDLISVML